MRLSLAKASLTLAIGAALLTSGCSGGGGGGSSNATEKFALVKINVLSAQEWQINRPIEILFNQDVDFSTVNLNTIGLINEHGQGATGVFSQPLEDGSVNRRKVRFQPTCPKLEDYSDAGLLPFSKYRLTVRGSLSGGTSVSNTAGQLLEQGALVDFATPNSTDAQVLFVDTQPGPPVVVVRGLNHVENLPATSLILFGEEKEFEWNGFGSLGPDFRVPLNHYSIEENQLQIVLQFNQPVDATPSNINNSMIQLQYHHEMLGWIGMQTEVELIQNCSELGASVRVSPVGLVPQESMLRIELAQGFRDLTGEGTASSRADFALMQTVAAGDENDLHAGIFNPEVDDILDPFSLSAGELGSLEDTQAVFDVPAAKWGAGRLAASFEFSGTGGPGGDFDWHIPPATEVVLDTVSDTITGGPGGANTKTQAVINGVVDIRNLYVPAGSKIRIVGPNVCTILASGTVVVEGEITVNGANSPGVGTLGTANQPEQGAKGQAGGGDGGVGSFLTTQSTPQGGRGFGAHNVPNLGGSGGETSYAKNNKNARRGAGGGGGRLGSDIYHFHNATAPTMIRVQALVGLDAEPGAPGGLNGLGAVSQSERAAGGEIGPDPFLDNDPDNNFLGTMILASGGGVIGGGLTELSAGPGGGAGGDAVNSDTFPLIPFTASGDEKGSGGGGGAGGLRILAIGDITIGDAITHEPGSITANGGAGGGGENLIFFDRVGGGSGAGAGGHVVMSTAGKIHIYGAANASGGPGPWYRDVFDKNHSIRPISCRGGQGGAGNQSAGGNNESGTVSWRCDSIPTFFDGGLTGQVPPFNPKEDFICFHAQPNKNDPSGFWTIGAGGDGSPGILQLHVNDPAIDLVFHDVADQSQNYMQGQDVTDACAPPPLGWKEPGVVPDRMVPFFGRLSKARSKWIPLGLARFNPGPPPSLDQVELRFRGTNTTTGALPGDGDGSVVFEDSILGPLVVGAPGFSMILSAVDLDAEDELYTENSRLLEGFTVMLEDSTDSTVFQHYAITDATYNSAGISFEVSLDASGENPAEFLSNGPINAYLIPHYVRVITNDVADSYPDETEISVFFDATVLDVNTGLPSETANFGLTANIVDLNAGPWDFVRFQVEFDIAKSGTIDITVPRPALDHLRMHFEF